MTMIRFQPHALDREILNGVEAWAELLAADRYEDAFAETLHRAGTGWTPELMRTVISNYGSFEPRRDGKVFRVTSPSQQPIRERGFFFEVVRRYGTDSLGMETIAGEATYDLPLNGERSDLSALFDLILVDGVLLLSLDDLHVL
jgi:hypothetical protein